MSLKKERVIVVEDERRDWGGRISRTLEKHLPVPEVTRRYLMIVKHPIIRQIIHDRFQTFPYNSGTHEGLFYCIAGPSHRRSRDFIRSLFRCFKEQLDDSLYSQVDILGGIEATRELMEGYLAMIGGRNGHSK